MNKKLLTTTLGLALYGASTLAIAADTVDIDFDGTEAPNSFQEVGSLDWLVGSSMAEGAVDGATEFEYTDGDGNTQTVTQATLLASPELITDGTSLTCTQNCDFNLYTHAELAAATDSGGGGAPINGLNSAFEWTFILGGEENIASQTLTQAQNGTVDIDGDGTDDYDLYEVTSTLTFEGGGQDRTEGWFFEIYYDDFTAGTNADALAGTGYDDGHLILESDELVEISGDFSAITFTYADVNGDGEFTLGVDFTIADTGSTGFVYELMDQFGGTDDWGDGSAADGAECDTNANGDTCYSVVGEGATALEASVLDGDYDTDFIKATSDFLFISDLFFTTENVDPFRQTQPSACYDTVSGGGTDDCNHVFGDLVNQDGTLSGDVINAAGTSANCLFATVPADCFAAATAGQDILFQTDANQSFDTTRREIPEPGTLALLGLGLGFLGVRRRLGARG